MSPNRLIHSASPYLLQHAHNPVDWYPWGEEALARARDLDLPIFLSIGYAACHWCHVMERESFEQPAIAEVLNRHFVPVKVDREERPDLDQTYMLATQLMTGRGGWPNSLWLLPDGRPWYAGTYFPPEDGTGRVGFRSLLLKLSEFWVNRRPDVEEQARRLTEAIRRCADAPSDDEGPRDLESLTGHALARLQDEFDGQHGGFGGAPKFPPHAALRLLLQQRAANPATSTLRVMIDGTLQALQQGGIHDVVGGGFHRYATDEEWRVPHFEKMLYDNAQLAAIFCEAWVQTGEASFRRTAEDTLDWVLREMTDEAGGFHASLDADSAGVEGLFYTWTREEIMSALGAQTGARFAQVCSLSDAGNFREESTGQPNGRNILYRADGTAGGSDELLAGACRTLRALREQRVWPGRDDKVITSWNGLMIRALGRAGRLLGRPDYEAAGRRAADFILRHLWRNQTLSRAWRRGVVSGPGFLEDYAAMALALLEIASEDHQPAWTEAARAIIEQMLIRFRDAATGNWASAGPEHGANLARLHEVYDQASPSAAALTVEALIRGARQLGEPSWLDRAREAALRARPLIARQPSSACDLLAVLAGLPDPFNAPPPPNDQACAADTCPA